MSPSDSNSNSYRRHSRFDPEPSPKRYRKHVKQERDRTKSTSNVENPGHRRHQPADPTQARPSSGQIKTPERGWWKDIKNQHDEKEEISQGRKQTEKKSQAKPDDNTSQKRVGFCERKECQSPTSRKRHAFRDKKILVDSGDGNPAATVVKSSQIDHPPKREEKRSNPYNMDRAHYKDKGSVKRKTKGQ
ncbi:unnamed protein product [Lathyrus oleraceus]|nr:uncharacterized protein LOC127076857 [Pisum sativum]